MKRGFAEHDLVASITRESFYEFIREFWDVIIPETPIFNFHIELMCDELQYQAELVFRNKPAEHELLVNIPPGTTKSTVASVMFCPWVWTRMPTARLLNASHTGTLGLDLSRKSRDVIRSEKYRACFPEVELRDDQDTKGHFQNTAGGMRLVATVGGKSPTGHHGHFLITDDPLDPQQALSEADLKAANSWMSEVWPTRKVDKRITAMAMVMQRLHEDDPAGRLLAKKKGMPVRHICLPATCDEGYEVRPAGLAKKYQNGLLDPIRLPREVLKNHKADGEYSYAGQFGQSPVPLGGGMFKVQRLRIEKDRPPDSSFARIIRYWDKAGTLDGGAYTVGVKIGVQIRNKLPTYWVLHVERGQWESYEREQVILRTARADGKKVIIAVEQEGGSGGKDSARDTVKRLAGFRVLIHKVGKGDGDKRLRAEPFASQVNGENVILVEADWNQAYIDELRYFDRGKYKDQVDASSGAFNVIAGKGRAGKLLP